MKMNCIAIDDEILALKKIKRYAEKIDYINLLGTFDSALSTLSFLRENHVDLIFLDIQMDEFTGIQLLESMKNPPYIVLTTAYDQYALKAYELDVIDYLLKPIPFDRFVKSVEKVYARFLKDIVQKSKAEKSEDADTPKKPEYIFVKSGNKTVKIYFDKILYIEGMRDYLLIKMEDSKVMTLQSFKNIQEVLDPLKFARVHKSYIVAMDKIEYIENSAIRVRDKFIPISNTYKVAFQNLLNQNNIL